MSANGKTLLKEKGSSELLQLDLMIERLRRLRALNRDAGVAAYGARLATTAIWPAAFWISSMLPSIRKLAADCKAMRSPVS